jgi:virginiamycin B lyase
MKRFLPLLALAASGAALAGGSNYNVVPGSLPVVQGRVAEWSVPTPKFARDPAPAPDGSIYIAVMQGNKIARFDPATRQFREWDLPEGAKPHGLIVDKRGIVYYTGNGNGTIGRLDPATGKVTEYKARAAGSGPHTIIQAQDGTLWFTEQSGDRIGRLDPASGVIKEYDTRGGPYGLALSKDGAVWFCQLGGNRMGRLDPATGKITEIELPRGSGPRRVAASADGSILWWAFYGSNELVKFDPVAQKILKTYPLPSGGGGGAYAVTVDGAGFPWVNEISADTVVRLDPGTEKMQVIKLPTKNTGIRKMVIAADGRLWYMGSHSGKIGVID